MLDLILLLPKNQYIYKKLKMITIRKYKPFTTFWLVFIFSFYFLHYFNSGYNNTKYNHSKVFFKNSNEYLTNLQITESGKSPCYNLLIKKIPIDKVLKKSDSRFILNLDITCVTKYLFLSGYSILKLIGILRI